MYKDAGKKLKSLIHIITTVGYALAVLSGLLAGINIVRVLGAMYVGTLIQAIAGIFIAGVVAGVLMFLVWIANVSLWIYADMSENIKEIKEELQNRR